MSGEFSQVGDEEQAAAEHLFEEQLRWVKAYDPVAAVANVSDKTPAIIRAQQDFVRRTHFTFTPYDAGSLTLRVMRDHYRGNPAQRQPNDYPSK